MWLGEVEAPTPSPGAVTVYGPMGQVRAELSGCRHQHQAGWVGGVTWVGGAETILDTFHLGLANSLAWQKRLENEMWGPVPKRGRGGREGKERIMVFASRSHIPCGMGTLPPRVSLKEGKQEAGTGKLGEGLEHRRGLRTDLFWEALEGGKPVQGREKVKDLDAGAQKPGLRGLTWTTR